jgi:hypothetical protein
MGVSIASLLLSAFAVQATTPTTPPAPPPACTAPEHRQFDFWLGDWDVYRTGTDRLVGRNLIERLYDGCAIRENWSPVRGSGGGSLNTYRPEDPGWRQLWVDSQNSWAEFRGGLVEGAMVIAGPWPGALGPGTMPLVRIRYTRGADGSVRQEGHSSNDNGATWAPFFDFTYRPRRQSTPAP